MLDKDNYIKLLFLKCLTNVFFLYNVPTQTPITTKNMQTNKDISCFMANDLLTFKHELARYMSGSVELSIMIQTLGNKSDNVYKER